MSAQTTNLFLLEDLEDTSRTSTLADSDLNSLRIVTDWINAFITQPDKELGRPGPVCSFVPGSLERKALWLAPEHIANLSVTSTCRTSINRPTRTTASCWASFTKGTRDPRFATPTAAQRAA
jgi:hypothetical protein